MGGDPLDFNDPLGLAVDLVKYANWMALHAKKKSGGQCALYVRHGLEAGGADTAANHPANAKDYADALTRNGFSPVPSTGYTPQVGDTAVFQPYSGGNPSGHIEMYDGTGWVSDFTQNGFFASPGYQGSQYTVYREN